MGQRMFVAIIPPDEIKEELSSFLAARPDMPWINSEQWHITLAFMENVPAQSEDELLERLEAGLARKSPLRLQLRGAGVFPNPDRAKVLWMRPLPVAGDIEALAVTARNAASKSGIRVDGRGFIPHLSVARLRRPIEATRWLHILETFSSSLWDADSVDLVASYLKEGPGGRPRHEVVRRFALRLSREGKPFQ